MWARSVLVRALVWALWAHVAASLTLRERNAPYCNGTSEEGYEGPGRPQFHFTSFKNWMGDPNGLVWYKGEYHLFFQKNHLGKNRASPEETTWGHAVSPDLLNWKELGDALLADEEGGVGPGSAVVDWANSSGLQQGPNESAIVVTYGAHKKGQKTAQRLAVSVDQGRTFKRLKFPAIQGVHAPGSKLVWDLASKQWLMTLVSRNPGAAGVFHLYGSKDLKAWTLLQKVTTRGISDENPDLFQLPIAGTGIPVYVFVAGDGEYVVGSFDGKEFKSFGSSGSGYLEFGDAFAGQTFANVLYGRRIQLAWLGHGLSSTCGGLDAFQGETFTGQMTVPMEFDLVNFPSGLRLRRRPAAELRLLRPAYAFFDKTNQTLGEKNYLREYTKAAAPGLEAHLRLRAASSEPLKLRLHLLGRDLDVVSQPVAQLQTFRTSALQHKVKLNASSWAIAFDRRLPLLVHDGALEVRVFVDRHSLEVFDEVGGATMALCAATPCDGKTRLWNQDVGVRVLRGKDVHVDFVRVYELKPAVPTLGLKPASLTP